LTGVDGEQVIAKKKKEKAKIKKLRQSKDWGCSKIEY